MFGCILLKGKLGSECLCQQIVELKVNKAETAVVVDGHGGNGLYSWLINPVSLVVVYNYKHFFGMHVTFYCTEFALCRVKNSLSYTPVALSMLE